MMPWWAWALVIWLAGSLLIGAGIFVYFMKIMRQEERLAEQS